MAVTQCIWACRHGHGNLTKLSICMGKNMAWLLVPEAGDLQRFSHTIIEFTENSKEKRNLKKKRKVSLNNRTAPHILKQMDCSRRTHLEPLLLAKNRKLILQLTWAHQN